MSVLVADRKESKLEVVTFSLEIHNLLIELMQRGFGIKDLKHYVRRRFASGRDSTEDFERYMFLMHQFKIRIDDLASLLTSHVRAANSIYPTTEREYEQRRAYQNEAIVSCQLLLKELQRVVDVFEVDINLFSRQIRAINREIGLIKKWRQHDKRIKSYVQGNV